MPTKILLDTGAAVSVQDMISYKRSTSQKLVESTGAVGASGMPLDVVGKVKMAVSLGLFSTEEEFTVIRNLTVDCLLGADFLKEHGAVMDCQTSTLSIGKKSRYHVPMFMAQQQTKCDGVAVTAPVDMEIPGRTIQLIHGELQGEYDVCEALVEPASVAPPTNLCIARTLTPVRSGKEVILQVMNVSPTPVTIYKGMKLGEAIPRHHVLMVNDRENKVVSVPMSQLQVSDFNLDHSDLSPSEKRQLQDLLTQFTDLFAPKRGPVGRTSNVKHSIPTEGPPVRQPL